jgi:hypothetical protein
LTDTIVPPHTPARELSAALLGASLVELERLLDAPPLPTADDLAGVASAFAPARTIGQHERYGSDGFRGIDEGRSFRLELGLGVIACRAFDASRVERAVARQYDRVRRDADLRAALADDPDGLAALDDVKGRTVVEWSAKSRRRMVQTFASLDYTPLQDAPGDLGMVTLTYPGRWEDVAPDGRTVKRHLEAFKMRWARAFGAPIVGLWKLEFQRRGAPHFHLLLSVPALMPDGSPFASWLSSTWASIVNAPDPLEYARHLSAGTGLDFGTTSRMADHKRIAVYFLKHSGKASGDKEYQHTVPALWQTPEAGPGRVWGFWGLVKPVVLVDVDVVDFMTARRVLRRATAARSRHIAYQRAKRQSEQLGRDGAAAVRAGAAAPYARPRSFGAGGSLTGGWLLANDGVGLALDVARYLSSLR